MSNCYSNYYKALQALKAQADAVVLMTKHAKGSKGYCDAKNRLQEAQEKMSRNITEANAILSKLLKIGNKDINIVTINNMWIRENFKIF